MTRRYWRSCCPLGVVNDVFWLRIKSCTGEPFRQHLLYVAGRFLFALDEVSKLVNIYHSLCLKMGRSSFRDVLPSKINKSWQTLEGKHNKTNKSIYIFYWTVLSDNKNAYQITLMWPYWWVLKQMNLISSYCMWPPTWPSIFVFWILKDNHVIVYNKF